MSERQEGLTLIELMVVVAVIAIIASIAIPNVVSARVVANESAAIATLKAISAAQAQVQASVTIDANNNGTGEYGYFGELSGGVGLRDSTGRPSSELLSPAALSSGFRDVSSPAGIFGGVVKRSGYHFQIFLPHASSFGLPEGRNGGVGAFVPDPAQSENTWCCYAWPSARGNTGKRAFFVNQQGEVLATTNTRRRYGGTRNPIYWAAFARTSRNRMNGTIAANTTGWDNQVWRVVN